MKLFITTLILFLLIGCSPEKKTEINANLVEKNKETAFRNDLIRLVQEAKKLEAEGRALDFYRLTPTPRNTELCLKAVEERTPRLEDFEARVAKLPDNYRTKLSPIFSDLNQCIACDKKAMESCKKARATINQAIKELFPQ